jgi:hypothetical protein
MLGDNCSGLNMAASSAPPTAFQGTTSVLGMMWQCDVCHTGNICDASSETHFFAVMLMAKINHESLSPSCVWNPTKIHGCLFHHQ